MLAHAKVHSACVVEGSLESEGADDAAVSSHSVAFPSLRLRIVHDHGRHALLSEKINLYSHGAIYIIMVII